MSTFAQWLRRFPFLFDLLNQINRRIAHQSPIYLELKKHLPASRAFTFLQIGANDGITTDPFREFVIRRNAHGMTVEPVPATFEKLRRNYKAYPNVLPVNCAVGYPAGHLPFFAFSQEFLDRKGDWGTALSGLAGFSRQKLLSCLAATESPDKCIQEIIVPVQNVENLMMTHGFDGFDCLFMDCEGHEENILIQLDYEVVKPRLIVFEHTHHGERIKVIDDHLGAQGFRLTRMEHDTIASR